MQKNPSKMWKLSEETYCFQCCIFYCQACATAHNIMRTNKDHRVLALKDFQDKDYEDVLKRPVFCPKHGHTEEELRPSSDVVLLPCRTKLQFGSTVARQEIYSDSDVVPESNQIQGLLEPRNNSPPNSPRERNLARTY